MSARNVDKHNRFRCITVGFRVSPEEHEHITDESIFRKIANFCNVKPDCVIENLTL